MTPAEILQAAIDKLERLKAESTPGLWCFTLNNRATGTHAIYGEQPGQEVVGATHNFGGLWDADDGRLIVTLHRTIDAQIAILREALFQLEGAPARAGFIGNEFTLFARLADAILGGTE